MTDGNSEEVARGGSEEEAAWLELIGRFDAPADSADSPAPWPEREDLPGRGETPGAGQASTGHEGLEALKAAATGERSETDEAREVSDDAPDGDGGSADRFGLGGRTHHDDGAPGGVGTAPEAERENLPPRHQGPADPGPWAGGRPGQPVYRQFELPAPPSPRSWTAPDDEDGGHYIPPPPPPLPNMSPVTKGAWVALFGGPAYLLVATLASWSVAGWALFLAIAAFIGGFTVLALRLGDHTDDTSDPDDDGAVV
ncbi:MAG TPA: hypothetical protein VHY58_17235 [Streptosporangiaceae bacterium]|nr:hypothetical protein [Streptosporangiaceae bacterium]